MMLQLFLTLLLYLPVTWADQWPYLRVVGDVQDSGKIIADPAKPHFEEHPDNLFVGWLHDVIDKNDDLISLRHAFINGTLAHDVKWVDDILDNIDVPANYTPQPIKKSPL